MNNMPFNAETNEVVELVQAMMEDRLEPESASRLDSLIRDNESARWIYAQYMNLYAGLAWDRTLATEENPREAGDGFAASDGPFPRVLADDDPLFPAALLVQPVHAGRVSASQSSNFHSVGGWALSYVVATVVMGTMLLGAWAYKIANHPHIVQDKTTPAENIETQYVGRITGLNDCVWAKDSLVPMVGVSVPMGRKYELISGLVQINYTRGARVILEGPCEYTVDSDAGGYLAIGKLTARIEGRGKSEERRGLAASATGAKHHAATTQSRIPNPESPAPSPQPLAPLFTVTTPTTVVADLGTEFGVSVDSSGNTASCVFEGAVRLQAVGGESRTGTILRVGEYARVERNNANGSPRIMANGRAGTPPAFVRRMHEPPKMIDLLDVVAGGNGTCGLRERGIDPTTGKQDTWPLSTTRKGGKEYKQVEWNKFVDGVFTPYIKSRIQNPDVQLDSAGHIFKGFADHKLMEGEWISNNLSGKTVGGIWVRAADCDSKSRTTNASNWMHEIQDDRRYMPDGCGLLGLHANAGITFDLEAIRREYEGARPTRFHAVAGLADGPRKYEDAVGAADLWIFVDGRLVWKRMYLRNQDGIVDINVELSQDAKFLSIATTNCRFGYAYDWVVLGDPVLEMKSSESEKDDEQ